MEPTASPAPHPHMQDARTIAHTRTLFWHNVVREMLNDLSIMCQTHPDLFDGRFGIVTHQGVRVGIKSIFPLFACSVPGTSWEREASVAVQCTVFRIATPDGEIYTLPVHEIAAVHSMTPELIEQMSRAEQEIEGDQEGEKRPFGLAAFTALPKVPTPGLEAESAI